MRIAVMGAGAVGGYFGGVLANQGEDVVLIARGAHGDAIAKNGLQVDSHWGTSMSMSRLPMSPPVSVLSIWFCIARNFTLMPKPCLQSKE